MKMPKHKKNNRRVGTSLVLVGLTLAVLLSPALAEDNNDDQYLTKGDAVNFVSATGFMKNKIGQLLSWTVGYDISKVNRVRLTPTVKYIRVTPRMVPPDGRTIFEIFAAVDDPGGIGNIQGVRADLSSVGRLSNSVLVDNGMFGDETAQDGIYSLQASVPSRTDLGAKEVAITVANKKGWLALAKANLDVEKDPTINKITLVPEKVKTGQETVITLSVDVENPGRARDIKEVTADLRALGYATLLLLQDDGKTETGNSHQAFSLQFTVPKTLDPGEYKVRVGVLNIYAGYTGKDITLKVER
ncbi:hypothetical protein A2291_00710 [candidate division WOR-1 bacterium RIFOXYB2_FULL_42_35]|uniref:CARDB domain-containing protein n=1 Tax=candidate division WOR-1 bacterium RIFOXYC2_FULL_41_25 TaxID=1802586 RepID=A0A1F4TS15_UNCSA|nr:MAG: hypothetical protein A2247_07935 [candidate division WOR-1 bacterium RIFOXYA2_FULL_41_14]OGC25748.1 MAG: hypothetical protein A2291_00710 [candidate division WOR-1 bacterium RIFOXYB2_FULL_42_35]OGC35350.1 MAG: hypothetical protein A2462_07005 [candidate division WOR-1 bacterium RIFOXYC2_FULL_41_25]